MTQRPPSGPGSSHYRGSTITLRHTTLDSTPLDEWSALRRDLYLTTHKTLNIQTSMLPAGFEPAIPARKLRQTFPLDRTAIENGITAWSRERTMVIWNPKDEWNTLNKECKCIWVCKTQRFSTDNRMFHFFHLFSSENNGENKRLQLSCTF